MRGRDTANREQANKPVNQPLFIVFEGTDGSGTTTQGDLLTAALKRSGRTVLRTAEPTDGDVGVMIRNVLRARTEHPLDPAAVALLFAADRVDHCARIIGPALARNEAVICDRYLASSLTFQVVDGDGRITPKWICEINKEALKPDLTILLDLPVTDAMTRIHHRGKPRERFEVAETLEHVRARYREVFREAPERLGRSLVLDASRSREAIAYDVLSAVLQIVQERAQAALESGAGDRQVGHEASR